MSYLSTCTQCILCNWLKLFSIINFNLVTELIDAFEVDNLVGLDDRKFSCFHSLINGKIDSRVDDTDPILKQVAVFVLLGGLLSPKRSKGSPSWMRSLLQDLLIAITVGYRSIGSGENSVLQYSDIADEHQAVRFL